MFSVRVGFVAVISMFAIACNGSSSSSSPMPVAPSPTAPSSGSPTIVAIPTGAATLGSNAFNPNPVTVAAGSTVTWTNTDSIPHTSTSDGTFHYHCAIHPGMVGTVIVQ